MQQNSRPFFRLCFRFSVSVSSWRRLAVLKAVVLVAAVSVLAACESPRLTSVFQGSSVPVAAKTAPKPAAKPVEKAETAAPDQPQARQIARPLPPLESAPGQTATPSAAATDGQPKTPSLVPLLSARPRPGQENLTAPGTDSQAVRAPITPLAPGSTVRVALLVPLSGPYGKLGEAMLNAAQMALFEFSNDTFELLVHDTGGTPEGALEAARLAIGDGASLILGPLLAPSVRAVAAVARAAQVPVIGFSSDRTITGGDIYTMGFFPESEVRRLTRFARSRGIVRFAALAPDNAYGQTVIETLRQQAEALGAVVTRVQFYDPALDDFSGVVRDLADYDYRRNALLAQRQQLAARDDEISARALRRLAKLQTIGDLPFDALLLADGGKRLLAIAALLPFYDIDPKKVRMLGTGQWDMPGLGAEPALLGGWYAGPPPAARADFIARYEKIYGAMPHRLSTLAYDATALAAVLSRNAEAATGRPDFSNATLTNSSGFWGRDGIFRFLADGSVERGLAVLQVEQRGQKIIDPAPEAFAAVSN